MENNSDQNKKNKVGKIFFLSIGALGVVYGDLGTSPLYTINECFALSNHITITENNVLGILSLIFWSLTIVVIIKYLFYVMRADNAGEGGMMALISLLQAGKKNGVIQKIGILILLGIGGTCLQLADSVLTPSITVLSAIEGLEIVTPAFKSFIVPITVGILIALFLFQKKGTEKVGKIFGPLMITWFLLIAYTGVLKIGQMPVVFKSINPFYALYFFIQNKLAGFFILGSVVLCFTGGEALYADMGHFGKKPIKYAWLFMAYPCLLLNYFGQGANLLLKGQAVLPNVFYSLAEGFLIYPMIIIATIASIIASQAMISGAFSLTRQAMQLGFIPRLNIIHTSHDLHGQIYIPAINYLLMIGCIFLVVMFKSSASFAAAYGMAVMGTMTITSILLYSIAVKKWNWRPYQAAILSGLLLCFDLPYLAANLLKLLHGAWIPLVIGFCIFIIILTWIKGRQILYKKIVGRYIRMEQFIENIEASIKDLIRVKGTAVFLTSNVNIVPVTLLHHFKHNKVLHQRIIILSVKTQTIPIVKEADKIIIKNLGHSIYQVQLFFGYMETPDILTQLDKCRDPRFGSSALKIDLDHVSYFLGNETLITSGKSPMSRLQKNLFVFLSTNAKKAGDFFNLPPGKVTELGIQIEI